MSSASSRPFPFMEFPREIRNKVYRNLLCTFEPITTTPPDVVVDKGTLFKVDKTPSSVDTSILYTNTQIHREAFDVMIRTNRFVLLDCGPGIPLNLLLLGYRISIVATDTSTFSFNGYVLSVSLSTDVPFIRDETVLPSKRAIILYRDLHKFCEVLHNADAIVPGLTKNLDIAITVGPSHPEPRYKDTLTNFFTEKTQKDLLQPFRTKICGFKSIKVFGKVSAELAESVQKRIAEDYEPDTHKVLGEIYAFKEKGQRMFHSGDMGHACTVWREAANYIEVLHGGSSWDGLVQKGGKEFAAQVAEQYFLFQLNIVHIEILAMKRPEIAEHVGMPFLVENCLQLAARSLEKGHWMKDYKWRPSDTHKAKLLYRWAVFLRLLGGPNDLQRALMFIKRATELVPGDAVILKEQESIKNVYAQMARG